MSHTKESLVESLAAEDNVYVLALERTCNAARDALERMTADRDAWKAKWEDLEINRAVCCSRMERRAGVLAGLVREVEWSASHLDSYGEHAFASCPVCGGDEPGASPSRFTGPSYSPGHKADCRLARALASESEP